MARYGLFERPWISTGRHTKEACKMNESSTKARS
jgi:hypothetical protein